MARSFTLVALLFLLPRAALPCGGGFGAQLEIDPEQTITVVYRDAVETYIFNPHFCGEAAEFGLILPIPSALTANPQMADDSLMQELGILTAPTVVTECYSGGGCGAADDKLGGGPGQNLGDRYEGVDVIDAGQVGIFDWTLLLADTNQAFTDWLDTNGYPYETGSAEHFTYYVDKGWYFVAFKVTAGEAPPVGQKLCGNLGPISLQFDTLQPVIPARIAAVNTDDSYGHNVWQVYTIAGSQMRVSTVGGYYAELLFSGALEQLGDYPALSSIAEAGERITKLNVHFPGAFLEDDILLENDPNQRDFRATVTVYEECGCAASASGGILPALLLCFGVCLSARLARRGRRQHAR